MVSKSVARTERSRSTSPVAPAAGAEPASRPQPADDTTEDMLRRYRLNGSRALFARVVERHRAVVEGMAAGLALRLPPSVDARDLVHAGLWGLMQAIRSYQPERCDQFSAFMRICTNIVTLPPMLSTPRQLNPTRIKWGLDVFLFQLEKLNH